jgi:hypothetical protein
VGSGLLAGTVAISEEAFPPAFCGPQNTFQQPASLRLAKDDVLPAYRGASTDQVPGPIANVDPRTTRAEGIPAVAGADRAIQASMPAASTPAKGVYKPAISRMPASAPTLSSIAPAYRCHAQVFEVAV